MKTFKISVLAMAMVIAGLSLGSCSDANEYEDAQTGNPSWTTNYTDSAEIPHPDAIAFTKWVRGSGLKYNAYGEEIQGFVESIDFLTADSCQVKMSEGVTTGTWTDQSNNDDVPYYEYTYSNLTGSVEILALVQDEKGNVSKTAIFTGVVVSGSKEVMTIVHYGDTPVQTYLVKQ